eukprot:TRINITY_DN6933_c2_g5_i1.p1 TRINITY_DN6933_c2_g5~~TRINITY_DN6933_c2_g5_i1.p1  ORF type:complete len:409 (+),score=46.66 TRINITY_DN6933_c2_g5_i1:74-1300(+)
MKLQELSAYKIVFLVTVFLMLSSVDLIAQSTITSLKQRKVQNEKDIAYTSKLLTKTLKNKEVNLGLLSVLDRRMNSRQALIQTIENELVYIGSEINRLNSEITKLENELSVLKEQYAKIIIIAYKQRNSKEKLMFLLSSKDFNQAYKRYKYLQQFTEYCKTQGKTISVRRKSLENKLNELNKAKKGKQSLLSEKTEETINLSREKDQHARILNQLRKKERQLRDDLKKQKSYAQKLEKEIQKIIKRQARIAAKKKSESGKYSLTPEEKILSNSFGQNKGKLPWPTKKGFISEKFGEHQHPVLKHVTVRNDGINITTEPNSECRVIFKGEVTHILSMPGLNNVVIVRHGEFFSVYSNLAIVNVKKGDLVAAKEKIGVVYTDGTENQTVLKFQLWKGSTKLNPASWLYRN